MDLKKQIMSICQSYPPSAFESPNPGSPLTLHLEPGSNSLLREGLSSTSFSLKAACNNPDSGASGTKESLGLCLH